LYVLVAFVNRGRGVDNGVGSDNFREELMTRTLAIATLTAVLVASSAAAADTPRMTYIKAKCAVCHGEDGKGKTPEGKRRNVPDLTAPAVQKRSDAEIAALIRNGHARMPSFNKALSEPQIAALVAYMRVIAKAR
jgi:mono/diheme cytochrome c family protein